ncbi:squamous cell carcinoma antigen recognized by T-cells 3-like [Sceloporus undulatus]|uniref:squamous cell carcinoma antigen recognized by T-cells 3-like n=1 Tax=Sceloporus undulatus TaxID=8520 RepID=UPI001C4DA3DC|nr:squamous cell carcinoma antigen recognized by T-cells 3-like [Sceloporus undulatus]
MAQDSGAEAAVAEGELWGGRGSGDEAEESEGGEEELESEESSAEDEEKENEAEIQRLEEQLSINAFDYNCHLDLIKLLHQEGELVKLRRARQKMSELFPLTEGRPGLGRFFPK